MRPDLVLCLGNEILSDDSFGFKVSQLLQNKYNFAGIAEIVFSALGGFKLIDLLKDRERVLVIDTIITGKHPPGTIHFFEMGHFTPAKNLTCSHQISLPTALEMGREYGMEMPSRVDVLAVEAKDLKTFSEKLTPPVEAALASALKSIVEWIEAKKEQSNFK